MLLQHPLVAPLHAAALRAGCGCFDAGDALYYNARSLGIAQKEGKISFFGEYDLNAFLELYRGTDSDDVRRFLFEAAIPCEHCIGDKCTTLLAGEGRTIEHRGRTKKLCGPFRHSCGRPSRRARYRLAL